MFAQEQDMMNESWKRFNKEMRPIKTKKLHYCPECMRSNYRIKLEYKGNTREQLHATMYNVDTYICPRCKKEHTEKIRIDGKGKTGVNMGRIHGGE